MDPDYRSDSDRSSQGVHAPFTIAGGIAQGPPAPPSTAMAMPLPSGSSSAGARRLLLMAGLPLIDGVFASAVMSGAVAHPLHALFFGVFVFSGAGCWFAVSQLQGRLIDRLEIVARQYLLVAVGAGLCIPLASVIRSFTLPGFRLFSALVLLGVAADLAGFNIVPKTAPPSIATEPGRSWIWKLRLALDPQTVLAVALAASFLYCVTAFHTVTAAVGHDDFGRVTFIPELAVLSGLAITVLATLASSAIERRVSQKWLARLGAAVLTFVAIILLGLPIPAMAGVVIIPAIVALIAAATNLLARRRSTSSNPDKPVL